MCIRDRRKSTEVASRKKECEPCHTRRKRKARVVGKTSSRSSLRCRGVSGDDPLVLFPDGKPVFCFPRKDYDRPICRMYGVDREYQYKGYFFCSNCKTADLYLTTKGMVRSSYNVTSKHHGCEANHECYAFPTDRGQVNKTCLLYTSDAADE